MTAKLIDGKILAAKIRTEIAAEIAEKKKQGFREPGLASLLIGDDPASIIYVKNKHDACLEVGIYSDYHHLPATISEEKLKICIQELNQNKKIDGILLQLPLPSHLPTPIFLELINPKKDVDGLHPLNLGKLLQRHPVFRPCTPLGIMYLLHHIQKSYQGQHAVIVGASTIVGKPMALELLSAGCTVTLCHRLTQHLKNYVEQADILISAVGHPELIKGAWIKKGAIVIDVGMNRCDDGRVVGDIEFETAKEKASWITPVPGGVGPMTVAMLLKNTLEAYLSRNPN